MPRGTPITPENQREFVQQWIAPKGKIVLKGVPPKVIETMYSRIKYVERQMNLLKTKGAPKTTVKSGKLNGKATKAKAA